MEKSLEDRVLDLEAQVRALMNLVMSDIASTTEDGLRDIDGALAMADGQRAAAARTGHGRAALFLGDMIRDIRAVMTAAGDD